ncbi:hypothetical protein JCM1841_003934 [Sporobolomyces salmonicolor]
MQETAPAPPTRRPSTSARPPPRGILKNAHSSPSSSLPRTTTTDPSHAPATNLAWDEANLTLNELQKDSTMKIDEPKTPYVRYNPETDEVMDLDQIPGFSLGSTSFFSSQPSPSHSASPSSSSRRGSEASEKMVRVERSGSTSAGEGGAGAFAAPGGMREDDIDSDDEPADEETKEHRKQFAQKRGQHYSNEAEAMKRAQALLADEDESEEAIASDEDDRAARGTNGRSGPRAIPPVPPLPKVNGA